MARLDSKSFPGRPLKDLRLKRRLSILDVSRRSRQLVESEHCGLYEIDGRMLRLLEKGERIPSIYQLYALAAVYRIETEEIARIYGIDESRLKAFQNRKSPDEDVGLPVAHGLYFVEPPAFVNDVVALAKTHLLSFGPERLGDLPILVPKHFDPRTDRLGYVGTKDFTMYPVIAPGTVVLIDTSHTTIDELRMVKQEQERSIYFLQIGSEFVVGWCEVVGGRLVVRPHPLSSAQIRTFDFPGEARVLGRICGLSTLLGTSRSARAFLPSGKSQR